MSDQNTILPDILTDKTKIFILSAVVWEFARVSSTVNEGIRALLNLFIFSLQEDFSRTKSIKSTKLQTSDFPPLMCIKSMKSIKS